MRILLLGPQGSGKGTQAKRIAAEYGLPHIATGDILRGAISEQTALGRRVAPILARGQLVPDELTIELIRERLAGADGFILDGFPRTLAQADALDEMLAGIGKPLDVILELFLSDELATRRMLGRAREEGRSDDTPEAIAERLRLYHELTEPVVEHYRARGNLVGIHGDRTVNEVFAEIQATLEQVEGR